MTCERHQSHQSLSSASTSISSTMDLDAGKPPPLPPKKKHSKLVFLISDFVSNISHTNKYLTTNNSFKYNHGQNISTFISKFSIVYKSTC